MDLRTYLRENGIRHGEFADRIGVHRQTLHQYLTRSQFPRPATLVRIVDETNGDVTANDFLPTQADSDEGAAA